MVWGNRRVPRLLHQSNAAKMLHGSRLRSLRSYNGFKYDQFTKLSDTSMGNWRGHQEGLQAWANDFGEPDPRCRQVHNFECDDMDAVSDLCLALDPNNIDVHSPFFVCSNYVEKTAAHIACLIDGCNDRSSLCDSFASYAQQCLNAIPSSRRATVCSWAADMGCDQECGANSVFEGCASTCQAKKTCRNRHKSDAERCGGDINEIDSMCICEPGYVLDDGNCVLEADCGCVWDFNGVYYSQGASFSNDEEYLASLGGQDDNQLVIWNVSAACLACSAQEMNY